MSHLVHPHPPLLPMKKSYLQRRRYSPRPDEELMLCLNNNRLVAAGRNARRTAARVRGKKKRKKKLMERLFRARRACADVRRSLYFDGILVSTTVHRVFTRSWLW